MSDRLLLDAHVHGHACFDPPRLLDEAWRNLSVLAGDAEERSGAGWIGLLCFVDAAGQHGFDALRRFADAGGRRGWSVRGTVEEAALIAERGDGSRLVLLAGRQIASAERLEVLALGTTTAYPEGEPFGRALERVLADGVPAVVPWGFGKWSFGRGRMVARCLETTRAPLFFLGDNGGRADAAPRPALFRRAAERGVRVLAGSDPLPFGSEVRRVGSYASEVFGRIDTDHPARDMRLLLSAPDVRPTTLGRPLPFGAFLVNQVRLRLQPRGLGARR